MGAKGKKLTIIMFASLMLLLSMLLIGEPAFTESIGTCGDNLTWILDDYGVLTISGTGAMSSHPWEVSQVKQVVIEDGVTNIGIGSFFDCSDLMNILIPDSVTEIGNQAFKNCSSLNNIILPNGLTFIGEMAFDGCSALRCIEIPNGVINIRDYTFRNCVRLMEIIIPESVTTLGARIFDNCSSLQCITFPNNISSVVAFHSSYYTADSKGTFENCNAIRYAEYDSMTADAISKAGYSFRVYGTKYDLCFEYKYSSSPAPFGQYYGEPIGLTLSRADKDIKEITIPEEVTRFGSVCFMNSEIEVVNFQCEIKAIQQRLFSYCRKLREINIPSSVQYIGEKAFEYCESLTSITIPDGVTSISDYAFSYCYNLSSIVLPKNLISIGYSAFVECRNLKSIYIPESVAIINSYAFHGCKSIENITIPTGVTSIGNKAFSSCNNLTSVCFLHRNSDQLSIETDAFSNSHLTVYCYEYSEPETWARQNNYNVILLDDMDMSTIRLISLVDDFRIASGEERYISVNVFPNDYQEILWTSSNIDVVQVDNGKITAKNVGKAIVTASVDNVSDSVEITVYNKAKSFELNHTEEWIIAKDSIQISPFNITPLNAEIELTWESSDNNLATVDDNGLVNTYKPGIVTISADSKNGIHRECILHLCRRVNSVTFDNDSIEVNIGKTVQLKATVITDLNYEEPYENKLVSFTSSDSTVLTVDRNGKVLGVSSGNAQVFATSSNGISASVNVTVNQAIPSLLNLPSGLIMIEDEAFAYLPIESVIIPYGCTTIGSKAFAYCENLTYVFIPDTVTYIASDAFEGSDNVEFEYQ